MFELFLGPSLHGSNSVSVCFKCHKPVILCQYERNRLPYIFHDGDGSNCIRSPQHDNILEGGVLHIGVLRVGDIEAHLEDFNDLEPFGPLCEKRHRHDDFIKVDDFDLAHLPEDITHVSMYVWLRHCVPLVVRLLRNDNVFATGRACFLPQDVGKTIVCDDVHCPHIRTLGQNHLLHGGLGIITNKHVVQNDDHAATTKIEFFYDNEERDTVLREMGTEVHVTNRTMDYTTFKCYVHSMDTITIMEILDKLRNFSWLQIPKKLRDLSKKYAIIISHPHGAPKRISIGKVIEREVKQNRGMAYENAQLLRNIYDLCENNNAMQRFGVYLSLVPDIELPVPITWYDTATCQGSSGAPVFMGDVTTENGQEINQAHTHRGVDKNKGYNNCFT